MWAVPFGIVCGRLYHVVTDNQLYDWFNNELYGEPTDLPWKLQIQTMNSATARQ